MTTLTRKQTPYMRERSAEYWKAREEILEDPRVQAASIHEKRRVIDAIRLERGL